MLTDAEREAVARAVAERVKSAPRLSDEQRQRLAMRLRPAAVARAKARKAGAA
jgi:hypothetical protein